MTEIEFVKWAVIALMGLGVWFMKRTLDKAEKRLDDLEKADQVIREEYLHKADFRDFKMELRSMFEEIKVDLKALQTHELRK